MVQTDPSLILPFDEAAGRIEALYRTPDIAAQRRATLRALALQPGERVVDIGSGPGFLAAEMANAVGSSGRVIGIDLSPNMLALAQARCGREGLADRVEFHGGDARRLPFPDDAFDAAVAAQTYGYVGDITAALAELYRVVRPGGRAVVVDTDWDSIVWHTTDRARMEYVLGAWTEHLADPHLPRTLGPRLRRAGFIVQRQEVVPLFNPDWSADTFSHGLIGLIQAFVVGRRGITPQEAAEWAADLRRIGESHAYFFSLNRYLFLATKSSARSSS